MAKTKALPNPTMAIRFPSHDQIGDANREPFLNPSRRASPAVSPAANTRIATGNSSRATDPWSIARADTDSNLRAAFFPKMETNRPDVGGLVEYPTSWAVNSGDKLARMFADVVDYYDAFE